MPDTAETFVSRTENGDTPRSFYGRSYYPGVTDLAAATPLSLAPGENRFLEIRVGTREPKTVAIDISGVSKGARVQLALERRTPGYFPPTIAKGSVNAGDPVEIQGLSEAEYTLIAWSAGETGSRVGAIRRFSPVTVSRVDLTLEPTLTLQGVVRGEAPSPAAPVGDWNISLKSDDTENPDEGSSYVRLGSDETFRIPGLMPGRYQVYASAPPGWVVSKIQYGSLDAIHQIFTLHAGTTPLVVTLTRQFGAVAGRLTDRKGPVDNAMVVLVPQPMPENAYVYSFPWTALDENGRYEFREVPSGRYRVIPFYGSTLPSYHDLAALRQHAKGYVDLEILPGKVSIADFCRE